MHEQSHGKVNSVVDSGNWPSWRSGVAEVRPDHEESVKPRLSPRVACLDSEGSGGPLKDFK